MELYGQTVSLGKSIFATGLVLARVVVLSKRRLGSYVLKLGGYYGLKHGLAFGKETVCV